MFPVGLYLAMACSIIMVAVGLDGLRREKNFKTPYPPAVEDQLRLALHYTHISPDPETASSYFMEAIKKAEEAGLDPYSNETISIRLRFSEMLEQFGHVKAAIEILDGLISEFQRELDLIEQTPSTKPDTTTQQQHSEAAEFRMKMIKWIVKLKVKVSSLYESDYLQNSTMAKQVLSDAVGMVVKEMKDPQQGLAEDNGAGITSSEFASMLSQMGDMYATTGEEENAVQLYMLTLQPLRASCNGTRSCKEVQVLSNIASSMDMALKKPNPIINGKPATKDSLAAGRKAALRWADQAIATADVVNPEDKDDICTAALLSAQLTRADLLLDIGEKAKSKEAFSSLLPVLKEKNLLPLVDTAEQGLKKASS